MLNPIGPELLPILGYVPAHNNASERILMRNSTMFKYYLRPLTPGSRFPVRFACMGSCVCRFLRLRLDSPSDLPVRPTTASAAGSGRNGSDNGTGCTKPPRFSNRNAGGDTLPSEIGGVDASLVPPCKLGILDFAQGLLFPMLLTLPSLVISDSFYFSIITPFGNKSLSDK